MSILRALDPLALELLLLERLKLSRDVDDAAAGVRLFHTRGAAMLNALKQHY